MTGDPKSYDDFLERYNRNVKISGYGYETRMHTPCPFCGAADWAKHNLHETEERLSRPIYCTSCKRTGKMVFEPLPGGGTMFELVQTDGPDMPLWYTPPPRRLPKETTE